MTSPNVRVGDKMSKFFKNNKSDEEYSTFERSKTKPRSYSCKPDIGPSGDHKHIGNNTCERRQNIRANMWLNNLGSGTSQSSHSNSELYSVHDDHLEKINAIRRKLDMIELNDVDESKELDETDKKKLDPSNQPCSLSQEHCIPNRSKVELVSKMSAPNQETTSNLSVKTKISKVSSESSVRYKPPMKKIRVHKDASSASGSTDSIRTACSKAKTIKIPPLNLDEEPLSNENKSIQCTSKDTELTEFTSHSSGNSKRNNHREFGDNIDLVEEDLYVEPEIVLKQPQKTISKNCIKFLPIKDDEKLTYLTKSKKEFYDDIVSNCSFSMGHQPAPNSPSHDSFFKSKISPRKKRFKKKSAGKATRIKLYKPSIEVRRTFDNTSEISDSLDEIEIDDIPAVHVKCNNATFDNTLMTGLALPSRIVKPIKLPQVTKLTELIHGAKYKKSKFEEVEGYVFEEDASPPTSRIKQYDTDYNSYKKAVEDLVTRCKKRTMDDIKENAIASRRFCNSNKVNAKQRQSVDYNFYADDLPESRPVSEAICFNQAVEEDEESGCLRAIENCCCIRMFRKRRNFFSS